MPEDESHITDVADVAKINWKTAKRIDKKYLSKLVTGIDDLSPTKLGVDEIAIEKVITISLTVVRDLDIGRVIWIGRTRKKTALDSFFAELNRKPTPIDLLFKYGKVYHVDLGEHSMASEVPKKVRYLEERLGLNIFPK